MSYRSKDLKFCIYLTVHDIYPIAVQTIDGKRYYLYDKALEARFYKDLFMQKIRKFKEMV